MIFLVDQFKLNWYKKFSRFIQNDDSMVQKLEKSKEKLVDIVKNQYEKIKKRMEIRTETNSEDIKAIQVENSKNNQEIHNNKNMI